MMPRLAFDVISLSVARATVPAVNDVAPGHFVPTAGAADGL